MLVLERVAGGLSPEGASSTSLARRRAGGLAAGERFLYETRASYVAGIVKISRDFRPKADRLSAGYGIVEAGQSLRVDTGSGATHALHFGARGEGDCFWEGELFSFW